MSYSCTWVCLRQNIYLKNNNSNFRSYGDYTMEMATGIRRKAYLLAVTEGDDASLPLMGPSNFGDTDQD